MGEKSKIREITITDEGGVFNILLKRFKSGEDYDFGGLALLRKLLSNEKAKLLHIIKKRSPRSIYELAKMAKRDFKSVSGDIKLLEKFGFVDMIAERTGGRERLKPVVVINSLQINIKV